MAANQDANAYLYENVGLDPDPIAERDASAYVYQHVVAEAHQGRAWFYANVGTGEVHSREGLTYFDTNVGSGSIHSREGLTYFYENVIVGGQANLVGTAIFRLRQATEEGGGYGTGPYAEFRYGMGEEEVVEPVGGAASFAVFIELTAHGSVPQSASASLAATAGMVSAPKVEYRIAASLVVMVTGLEGPTPPGPPSRSEVCIPPWPETVIMRALKGGVGYRHDSAALCNDGRVLYMWVNGSIINQCHYPTQQHFADADNTTATAGVNIADVLDTGIHDPNTTVWRHYGTGHLFLFICYVVGFGAAQIQRSRVYRSMSGNGESSPGVPDWTLWGTIEELVGGGVFGYKAQNEKTMGEPFVTAGGRWVLPAPAYADHQGCFTSEDYGRTWTQRLNVGYYIVGGPYGYGQCRNIVEYQGALYWSASGNVEPAKGGKSLDGGLTWPVVPGHGGSLRGASFHWPGTSNSDLAQPLTADGTGLHVCFQGVFYDNIVPWGLEKTVDPPNTPRASRTIMIQSFPGGLPGILQRVGDCDYYMISGQILVSAPRGWGVGQVRIG